MKAVLLTISNGFYENIQARINPGARSGQMFRGVCRARSRSKLHVFAKVFSRDTRRQIVEDKALFPQRK